MILFCRLEKRRTYIMASNVKNKTSANLWKRKKTLIRYCLESFDFRIWFHNYILCTTFLHFQQNCKYLLLKYIELRNVVIRLMQWWIFVVSFLFVCLTWSFFSYKEYCKVHKKSVLKCRLTERIHLEKRHSRYLPLQYNVSFHLRKVLIFYLVMFTWYTNDREILAKLRNQNIWVKSL